MTMLDAFPCEAHDAAAIGCRARECLKLEVATYPKPGLVSHVDPGAHRDMDAALLISSAETLEAYFADLAGAGAAGASMGRLRAIGLAAERAMLAKTEGVNTHRGAIFGLGLLCAAAGFRSAYGTSTTLGAIIAARWGAEILCGPIALRSHGTEVARRHGAGGARAQAAAGFPAVYEVALPALSLGRRLAPGDAEAARVQACLSLIATIEDTNLLYRGGLAGLSFARRQARRFLDEGGVGSADWRTRARTIHEAFVARRLSPGGCADLLAMALFVDAIGA
ncbi:MAG TPA: triphosphoribosyl-dephospho-CoA synthase MdcB [Caulobacteraceae bacterium]|nr:triphosphoribosyl-dephospho-CoA synthase MdcB [Caulobacteraceae bacterium]